MADDHHCPRCNKPIDADQAGKGGCPSCLLELALESSVSLGAGESFELAAREDLEPGAEVGPYRIVRELGEGGMGVVYLAEQSKPLERKVALKVIKHGMDTRSVVRRFELERQTLAMLDHPAIARVFEAGATPSGRPYFVMEYIEGEPITDYADRRRLNTADRLELFTRVCAGLQHAHQRGIIHRDIKPSNVLVTEHDGEPAPKIIDFGVAKATERKLSDFTELTGLGVLLGTPEYMSPEQADLAPLDVDTRTDVYSLGVMLYELLTGALPFDTRRLREAAFDEIRRQIREVRPSKPSTRLSALGDKAAAMASSRRTDVPTLSRRLAGDLDLITMKALEKDRGLRYDSPAELAADIRRHLEDQPVLARPPSAIYQLRKLISRHRVVSGLIAALLITLVGFSVWMSVLYRRALGAEAEAAREAEVAKQVSDFVIGVFEISDPGEARGNSATARELLDSAAEKIDDELAGQPEVQATMMDTMGKVYSSLGLYAEAEKLARGGLERREQQFGEEDATVADSWTNLASIQLHQGTYDASEESARRAIAIREALPGEDPLASVAPREVLQLVHWYRRELDQAVAVGEEIQSIREAALGPDHVDLAISLNNLGNVYLAMGEAKKAEPMFARALELRIRELGPDHPEVGKASNNLAESYRRQARYDEAETLFLRVLEIDDKNLAPDHPGRAYAHNNLGLVYRRMERYDEAVAQYGLALAIREAGLPENHPLLAWTLDNLGLAYLSQGNLDEAGRAFRRALDIALVAVGPDHPDTAIVMANLGLLRIDQKRFAEAEELLLRALEINEASFGRENSAVGDGLHNLGGLYEAWGQPGRAIEHFREAVTILEATIGAEHPDTQDSRERLEKLAGAASTP